MEELGIFKGQVKKAIVELESQANDKNYSFDAVSFVNRLFYKNGMEEFFTMILELIRTIPEDQQSDCYSENELYRDWDKLEQLFEKFELNDYQGF